MKITRNYDVIELTDAEIAQAIGEWVTRKRADLGLPTVPLRMTTLKDVEGESVPMVNFYSKAPTGYAIISSATVQIDRPIPVED